MLCFRDKFSPYLQNHCYQNKCHYLMIIYTKETQINVNLVNPT